MAATKTAKKSTRKPAAKRRPANLDATFLLPPKDDLHLMIEEWVAEDVGLQDLTTNVMIPANAKADFVMNTRETSSSRGSKSPPKYSATWCRAPR